ncbi:hypothetical protein ACZ91_15450 [Streptomyces regensis]|nr:hypothetical protein ACZ91_15450 [Streptomyces regensis]
MAGAHRLRFMLEADGAGCVLTFEHTFADNPWAEQTFTGWQQCLDVLRTTVDRLGTATTYRTDGR